MNPENGLTSSRISCKKKPHDDEKQLIQEQHFSLGQMPASGKLSIYIREAGSQACLD